MHNCGSRVMRVATTALAVWLLVCAPAAGQTAKERYQDAQQQDEKVRLLLTNFKDKTPATELAVQVAQVLTSFEALVRRFPTSGYADDALFHAASLADAAYQRMSRPEDRDRALKTYRWLVREYPRSALIKQANAKIARLTKTNAPPVPPSPAPPARSLPALVATPPVTAIPAAAAHAVPAANVTLETVAPPPAPALPAERATLTSVQRTVLPGSVRVTLEFDREVAYREQRLSGPARVFFDLNVQVTPALADQVLSYNTDVVAKIRVGRRPEGTVRVVLDLENVPKFSVFTLYSPFRLVVDAERPVATTVAAPAPAPPAPVEPTGPAAPPIESREAPLAPPVPETPPPPPVQETPPPPPVPADANVTGGFSIARQLGLSVSRIVIDPGHGGHDPGTTARGLNEADLTLDIALRVEKLLAKEPGVEVVLTRRTDVHIPLQERTAIANRQNADLFLSIHANSSRNRNASGIETYFLSFASSPEAEAIAARENSTSGKEMHELPDLIKAISLNNKLDESRDLAGMVQESLVTTLKRSNKDVRSRGVKKAPFVVLIGAAMPSVLAEISFMTNRQELALLKTAAYKDRIAQALSNAVLRYRKSLKGTSAATVDR